MAIECPKCHTDNPAANRFCDTCGTKMDTPVATAKKQSPSPPKIRPVSAAPVAIAADAAGLNPGEGLAPGGGLLLSKEIVWLTVILLLGLFLRLWDLGAKPLHHDESIHAWYAFKLFKGDTYRYDPAYHGPFLYHANALMYFIFGASDFTSRLLPAFFGTFIIAFMWQWRSLLGTRGSLFAAGLIAISPTWTYVSRFIRDDIYMTLGNLAMVWGVFKWFETKKDTYLYWGVLGWMVAFTSMEATWIFMGLLGTYLFFRWLWESFFNDEKEYNDVTELVHYLRPLKDSPWFIQLAAALGMPLTLLLGALGIVKLNESWKVWAKMLLIFFIPFTLMFTTFFTYTDGWARGAVDSIGYWLGEQKTSRADQPWQFYIYLLLLYEIGIVFFALLGGMRIWLKSGKAQFFFLKVAGAGPVALAIYLLSKNQKDSSMLIVTAGLATLGCGMLAFGLFEPKKGNNFKTFLVYWCVLGWVMFTLAGERMPWLTLHPLTPLTLLAALYLGDFFSRKGKESLSEHLVAGIALAIPVGMFFLPSIRAVLQGLYGGARQIGVLVDSIFIHKGRHAAAADSGMTENLWQIRLGENSLFVVMGLILVFVLAALWLVMIRRWPKLKYWSRPIYMVMFFVAAAGLMHGTSNLLFYGDGAHPREQHVYVQSSTELVEMTHKLERMSKALTGGLLMKIAVEDLCSWPMSWYLRDFKNAQIGFRPPLIQSQVPDFPVVLTGYEPSRGGHDQQIADSFSNSYTAYPIRFRKWWAPNKYAVTKGGVLPQGDGWKKVFTYYLYREPWQTGGGIPNPRFEKYVYDKKGTANSPYGSFDAALWVRKDVEKYFK